MNNPRKHKRNILPNRETFHSIIKSAVPLSTGFFGAVGGFLAFLPLPALLGPMLLNAVICLSGIKMQIHKAFLPPIFVVIGWYLGSKVTPDTFNNISLWIPAAIMLVIWMIFATTLGSLYFTRFAKFDRLTATYAALPGALASIAAVVQDTTTADQRKVVVTQTIRVFMVVILLPIIFALILDVPDNLLALAPQTSVAAPAFNAAISWLLCIISSCIIIGVFKLLRVPSPYLLGGTLASAFFFGSGQLVEPLPTSILMIALYILGSVLGTRFNGCSWREVARLGGHGIIVTILLLLFVTLGAFISSLIFGMNFLSMFLAYVPGGVHEITIIAYAYSIEPLFVAFLHFLRIAIITVALPIIPSFFRSRVDHTNDNFSNGYDAQNEGKENSMENSIYQDNQYQSQEHPEEYTEADMHSNNWEDPDSSEEHIDPEEYTEADIHSNNWEDPAPSEEHIDPEDNQRPSG